MTSHILRRFLSMVPVLLVISIIAFSTLRLAPGDPAVALLGPQASRPENRESLERLRAKLGLDKPIFVQYGIWLRDVATGNLGESSRNGRPVLNIVMKRVPATAELAAASLLIGVAVAIPVGIVAARRRGTFIDYAVSSLAAAGLAIPSFWLGLMLILVFSVQLGWLPPSGYVPWDQGVGVHLKHLALPAVTLGLFLAASLTRFMRSEMVQVLSQDYIRTARAKGLAERIVLGRHALKNALIPIVTVVGIEMGSLLGGVVIIEQVFGWSGVGWLTIQAVFNRDYAVVQGAVLFITVAFLCINLVVDTCYGWLDPRIRV